MRRIELVPSCFGSLSAIAFALAAPSATAQELHGHQVCRIVGASAPEQLGDREGHALSIGQTSCQVTEGPLAGAVVTETSMLEWDAPKARSFRITALRASREPHKPFNIRMERSKSHDRRQTERLDSLRARRRDFVDRRLGVSERQELRVDRQGHWPECL